MIIQLGNALFLEMNRPAEGNHAKAHPVGKGIDVSKGSGDETQLYAHLQGAPRQVLNI